MQMLPLQEPLREGIATLSSWLGRRRLRNCRQHPSFPVSALSDIRCGPEARGFHGTSLPALAGDPVLAHPERCVGAQGPDLINRNLCVIEPRLEHALVKLRDIR